MDYPAKRVKLKANFPFLRTKKEAVSRMRQPLGVNQLLIRSSLVSLLNVRSITISGILIASLEETVNNISIILLVE